ncbi:hypothetical protein [Acinetobacter sp. A2]
MARRKKNDQSGGAAILYFGFILVLFVVSVSPIFILLYGLFFILKFYFKYQKINKNYSDFWLDEEEKQQFLRSYESWIVYDDEIEELHSLARRNRVSINANGNFSRKSKVGKQVQDRLDDIVPEWQSLKETKEYLEYLPQSRWKEFHGWAAKGLGGILGFVAWALVFEFLCNDYKVGAAQLFKDYSNFVFYEAGNYIFGLSGLAAIIIFFITK